MGFFDDEKNVEEYIKMTSEYDGTRVWDIAAALLPSASTVLELGMGPGKDFDVLKKSFRMTGSDSSTIFLERYRRIHSDADLLHLDAVTIDTDRRFDAIFSNKVLQHLTDEELMLSFKAQHRILNPQGIALHTLWYGDSQERMMGLLFNYHNEDSLRRLVGTIFTIERIFRYTEEEEDDSIVLVLKK